MEKKKQGHRLSTVFKVWIGIIVILAAVTAGLYIKEQNLHREWRQQNSRIETAEQSVGYNHDGAVASTEREDRT